MDNPPPASDMTAEEGNADRDLMDTTANNEVSIPEGATEIRYMDDGFSPAVVEVSVGSIVTFVNDSSRDFWPASDLHPTHKSYPGSSIGKCGTEEADSIFDACGGIAPGGSYSFTFDEVGEWNYHDPPKSFSRRNSCRKVGRLPKKNIACIIKKNGKGNS